MRGTRVARAREGPVGPSCTRRLNQPSARRRSPLDGRFMHPTPQPAIGEPLIGRFTHPTPRTDRSAPPTGRNSRPATKRWPASRFVQVHKVHQLDHGRVDDPVRNKEAARRKSTTTPFACSRRRPRTARSVAISFSSRSTVRRMSAVKSDLRASDVGDRRSSMVGELRGGETRRDPRVETAGDEIRLELGRAHLLEFGRRGPMLTPSPSTRRCARVAPELDRDPDQPGDGLVHRPFNLG